MAEDWKARPVSGEIMAGAPAVAGAPRQSVEADVVDAEFETIGNPAAKSPAVDPPSRTQFIADAPPLNGMDSLKGSDGVKKASATAPGGPVFWLVGCMAIAAAFWVSGGHKLVRGTAAPVPLVAEAKQLRIANVETKVDYAGERVMLFVDGDAVNEGAAAAPLPPIEIRVTASDGRVTLYKLGTAEQSVAPGDRFSFSSRLEVPKNGVKSVAVTFKESADAKSPGQGN